MARAWTLGLAAVAALLLASEAAATSVRVRIEGPTSTLFGAVEPRLGGSRENLTALDALALTRVPFHTQPTGEGLYVDRIAQFSSAGTAGWALKVNGVMQTAPDRVKLRTGDRVLWYWAQFGIVAGGPPTLALRRDGACYRVISHDDFGAATAATDAVLKVDGRRFATRNGRACLPAHKGLVRATSPRAIRSNALR